MSVHKSYRWLSSEFLWQILYYGISINVTLMLFNLLPLYPLDGYHIFELLFARVLPPKFFFFTRRYGRYILIGLLIIISNIGFSPTSQLSYLIWTNLNSLAMHLFL